MGWLIALSKVALWGLCGALSNCYLTLPSAGAIIKSRINKGSCTIALNNAVILQHCVAIENQQFVMIQWVDRHSRSACCSHTLGYVHGWSSCKFTTSSRWDKCREDYYSADLYVPLDEWVWPCWDPKGTRRHIVQSVGSLHMKKLFIIFRPRTPTEQRWSHQASGNACLLVLSTPDLYCSSNLRCKDRDMSYSHNYRHSIPLKRLWRGKSTAS